MKKLLLFLLLTSVFYPKNYAQLVAGDIAFIGMNTDTQEGYTFITLADIPGFEKIYFTDRGIASNTNWGPSTEGTYLFTAPASGIPCGTIVNFIETSADVLTIDGVVGASMVLQQGSFNLGSGDQIIAYQKTTPGVSTTISDATFIAAITSDYDAICVNSITGWTQDACVSSTSESKLPPGLINGTHAVSMTPTGPEKDNFRYNGTLTGTSTAIRLLINDHTNWLNNNGPSTSTIFDNSPKA